ncbi:MAG: gliding motility-associated C-terminal domain-containing protein [Bacteroidia bacterium]|nr:gliding motility-associated C-terminal domain-containing protein [Bacteroidia bacterium]
MKSIRLIISLLILTLTSKAKAQYTYAIYGGSMVAFEYTDTGIALKKQFTYLLSKTDQKIRITNYKNFDTSIQLIANVVKIVRIDCILLSIHRTDGAKIMHKKTVFVESKDPVIINHAPLFSPIPKGDSDPFIKGYSGSYTVLEKNECGHDYTIYNPNSLSQQTGYGKTGLTRFGWFITVTAFYDSTWVDFNLNYTSELGRQFSVLLNKGETIQICEFIPYVSKTPVYTINQGRSKITARDCKKSIAVFNSKSAFGVIIKTEYTLDMFAYPSNGIEIEQLHPTNKFGYEFFIVSDGKSFKGNTYHLNSFGPNVLLLNGKKLVVTKDTLIYDTIFNRSLLIQSKKPIMVVQHVSGAVNYLEWGAPDAKVYANVIDITNAPPTHNLIKEITVPIPSRVGTNLINRVVFFSPNNRRITINGKTTLLTKQNKGIYYGSIHFSDTVLNIKSTTGFNGYIIHTGAKDTTAFWRTHSVIHRSGVFTIGNSWDTLQPRIRVNGQGVHWLGVDDTGTVEVCQNTAALFELETGWQQTKKLRTSLNDSFLHQLDSFQHLFKDTGLFTLKFDFEYDEHACDSGVKHRVSRRIRVVLPPQKLPFSDTLLCLGDTLRVQSSADPEVRAQWKSTLTTLCDTCRWLNYVPLPGQPNMLTLTLRRNSCPNLLDTLWVRTYDSLQIQVPEPTYYCYGQTFRFQFNEMGGDSSRRALHHYWDSDTFTTADLNKQIARYSDTLTSVLTDACNHPNDTLIQVISVRDSLNISGPSDTLICHNEWVYPARWYSASGGLKPGLRWVDSLTGASLPDSIQITQDQTWLIIASDGCSPDYQKTVHIQAADSLSLKGKELIEGIRCWLDSLTASLEAIGGRPAYHWNITRPNSDTFSASGNALPSTTWTQYGTYKIHIKDACNQELLEQITVSPSQKISSVIASIDSACSRKPLQLQVKSKVNAYPAWAQVVDATGVVLAQKSLTDSLEVIQFGPTDSKTLTVMLQDACQFTDTVRVLVNYLQKPSLNLDNPLQLCAKEVLDQDYQWQHLRWNTSLEWTLPSGVQNQGGKLLGNPSNGSQISIKISDPCFGDTSIIIAIHRFSEIVTLPMDSIFCTGEKIDLYPLYWKDTQQQIGKYIQLKKLNDGQSLTIPKIITGKRVHTDSLRISYADTHRLGLEVQKRNGQTCAVWSQKIRVVNTPVADFMVDLEPLVQGKKFSTINRSQYANRYTWTVDAVKKGNQTNIEHTLTDTGWSEIGLWASNEWGCIDSIKQLYRVERPTKAYYPTAFTPNGDGLNNVWHPQGDNIKSYKIRVYTRWGEKVFDGGENEPFTGIYQGEPLMEGAYVAVTTIKDIQNQTHQENQVIVLIRKPE